MRIFIAIVASATTAITSYGAAQGVGPQVELVHPPCNTKTSTRLFVSAKGVISLNATVTPIKALLPAPYACLRYLFEELPKAATAEALEALLPWNVKPTLRANVAATT